jgi:hypothetical protein
VTSYAFINKSFGQTEIFEFAEFDSLQEAVEFAKAMSDEMELTYSLEVWAYQITVQPYSVYYEGVYDDDQAKAKRNEVLAHRLLSETTGEGQ